MSRVALMVIAKEPVPGRVKTRLCPPCTPEQSADLAQAALADTLAAVRRTPAARRVLVLEGEPGTWLPRCFDVLPQVSGGLGARLAAAFEEVDGPALLIGMDTPQVTCELLAAGARALLERDTDAVLGPARDGGYWAIGLKRAGAAVFDGVPMSSARTCAVQRSRLRALGLSHRELARLGDVDTFDDAESVAAQCLPGSRFRAAFDRLGEYRPERARFDGQAQWATA